MRYYGTAELAEAVGVKPGTVAQWYRRGRLPEPDAKLKMGPMWTSRRIEPWIKSYKNGTNPRGRWARNGRGSSRNSDKR